MSNNAINAEQSAAITSPIPVTGTAGQVGSVGFNIVVLLRARGLPVRAMVRRDDDRSKALVKFGAEIVKGDLTDPGGALGMSSRMKP
jgi:uncharacterized protein YbjT (DUF2867 family)